MAASWTKTALNNLRQIAEFIEADNPSRAASFVRKLRQKTLVLEDHPSMGRPGRVSGTRELIVHENYIVVYRMRREQLEVIRVQHVAKRWPPGFD